LGCILLRLAVKRVPLQKRIVFLFLKPVGRAEAFLIARGHVTRDRRAEGLRFRAFQRDDFLRHPPLFLGLGDRLFFLAFTRLFIS
jgi:hypothetical protein